MGNPCNINELDFQPVFEVPSEPITIINGVPNVTLVQDTGVLDITSNPESDDDNDPCFGNWLEGREVQKKVQNKIHLGKVEKYNENENWYRVVYQDRSSEDLNWEKLEEILVPLDISIPITTLAAKMSISGKSIKGRKSHIASSKRKRKTSDSAQVSHNQIENKNIHSCKVQVVNSTSALEMNGKSDAVKNDNTSQSDSSHFEGRNVLKWFGNRHYFGEVKKYDKQTEFYTVVYEDGSSENLKWNELENLLVPINTRGTMTTVEAKSDKPKKMRVNRSGGKKKTNLREQMQSDGAMQSGSLIENVDDTRTGSLIESIDTMETGLMIESMDTVKSESISENKGTCEEELEM